MANRKYESPHLGVLAIILKALNSTKSNQQGEIEIVPQINGNYLQNILVKLLFCKTSPFNLPIKSVVVNLENEEKTLSADEVKQFIRPEQDEHLELQLTNGSIEKIILDWCPAVQQQIENELLTYAISCVDDRVQFTNRLSFHKQFEIFSLSNKYSC